MFVALTDTPLIGIVLSAGITALIHSSAATMGIALALATSGLIPLHAAIYIILGANIGTCSTALMASLRSPAEARRVAWAHVLFKVFGVLLFLPFLPPFEQSGQLPRPRTYPGRSRTPTRCSMSSWPLSSCPFLGLFSKLIMKLVPEKAEEKKFGPMYLDDHVLGTPSLALGQATREALRESDIVREMLIDSIKVFQSGRSGAHHRHQEQGQPDRHAGPSDPAVHHPAVVVAHLTEIPVPARHGRARDVRNLESIGDIIDRNIMPLAMKRITKGLTFSEEGMDEIIRFHKKVIENFDTGNLRIRRQRPRSCGRRCSGTRKNSA